MPAEQSQRQLRVGELIRHELSSILQRGEVFDPVLESHVVTISEVRLSPDLKIATCYVIPLGGQDTRAVVKALAVNKRFLRGLIARRVKLKFSPDLRFLADETFDRAAETDRLLHLPEVARDLVGGGDRDKDD